MCRIINPLVLLCCLILLACEDVIDVDLPTGKSQLVVDAFLTADSTVQTIRLTKSAAYFSNVPAPSETNAIVDVIGPSNKRFNFTSDGNGNFKYDPNSNGLLDSVGYNYKLELQYGGGVYMAYSVLNPVPPIERMTYEFREAVIGSEAGYYTEFFATDNPGRKDYYWIKAFKNGLPIDPKNPSQLILAEDGAFGGEGADGITFILPIRAAITNSDGPFQIGDISSVELWSMDFSAYQFIQQATVQANNGGLFSTPPANIKSNILDASGSLQEEVLGVFSLSSISRNNIQIIR